VKGGSGNGPADERELKKTECSELVPWVCHFCGRDFHTADGGVCAVCGQTTCETHFAGVETTDPGAGKVCVRCHEDLESRNGGEGT
jgi:hypothetical protein